MEVVNMKGKRTSKLLALFLTLALSVMMMTTLVQATDNYTPVAGTSTTFTKYLVIPADASVPSLTFNFSIDTGAAVPGDVDNLPIYAGNDTGRVTGAPTIAANQAAFTSADATTDGAADDGIANSTDYKYASKTVTVDFSTVSFKEPGVYRYIITEDNSTSGVTFDNELIRTLDVNVVDTNGALEVASYVMYYGEVGAKQHKTTVQSTNKNAKATGIATGDKCDNYVNHFPSHNLYVGKKISGNQASKDKYFRFTVTLTDAGSGTLIHVNGDYTTTALKSSVNGATTILEADEGETGYINPSSITTETDGTATVVFYLQGDQYVNLMGIPVGAKYTVVEYDYSADGYVSTGASSANKFTIGSGASAKVFEDETTGTVGETDIYTGFMNTKAGIIPTGVILAASGLLVSGVVVVAGIIFFGRRSKKKYEEE